MRSRLKVFLVENHADTLTYLKAYLESRGHDVTGARDMQSALGALAETPVDILISDIGLPDGDGWELMRRVRAMNRAPFGIAMSGYGEATDLETSRQAGYQHHLVKPFIPEDLDCLLQEAAVKLGSS